MRKGETIHDFRDRVRRAKSCLETIEALCDALISTTDTQSPGKLEREVYGSIEGYRLRALDWIKNQGDKVEF